MKLYSIKRTQFVPISLDEAWDFFSDPKNLKEITPDHMGFEITNDLEGRKMYAGQIITYKVSPLFGIKMNWVTEIKHVEYKKQFVDEQRYGPYAMWHHTHFFEAVDGGTKCTDLVYYKIPFGIFGRLANSLLVKKQLDGIFDYRTRKMKELFG